MTYPFCHQLPSECYFQTNSLHPHQSLSNPTQRPPPSRTIPTSLFQPPPPHHNELSRLGYHMLSLSTNILQHHLPNKDKLKAPTILTPNPPSSFGVQIDSQFIHAIFLLCSQPPQFFIFFK